MSRPGPEIRRKQRIEGARIRAQRDFLARFPWAVCHNCGERPEPGTIYRFTQRWNRPWCVHLNRCCPARRSGQATIRDTSDCLPAPEGLSPAGAPSRNLNDPA